MPFASPLTEPVYTAKAPCRSFFRSFSVLSLKADSSEYVSPLESGSAILLLGTSSVGSISPLVISCSAAPTDAYTLLPLPALVSCPAKLPPLGLHASSRAWATAARLCPAALR
jgi:hypothetical protein